MKHFSWKNNRYGKTILKGKFSNEERFCRNILKRETLLRWNVEGNDTYNNPSDHVIPSYHTNPSAHFQPNTSDNKQILSPFPLQFLPSTFRYISGVNSTHHHHLYHSVDKWITSIIPLLQFLVSS